MSFLGAILALLWDQLSPLYRPTQFDRLLSRYADWVLHRCNAGTHSHGVLAWSVAVLLPAILIALPGFLLAGIAGLLGLAWSAAVLYRCLGFRHLLDQAASVSAMLQAGDTPHARQVLAEMGLPGAEDLPDDELVQQATGHVLAQGLARMAGVLFWFALLGAAGAVAYALTVPLSVRWRGETDFRVAVGRIQFLLDWLPVRLLALALALAGNFEEAFLKWRGLGPDEEQDSHAILRAAGFGALGMQEEGADPEYVNGAAALQKRATLIWLAVLGLLWLSTL